jgi:hypothetical protein
VHPAGGVHRIIQHSIGCLAKGSNPTFLSRNSISASE